MRPSYSRDRDYDRDSRRKVKPASKYRWHAEPNRLAERRGHDTRPEDRPDDRVTDRRVRNNDHYSEVEDMQICDDEDDGPPEQSRGVQPMRIASPSPSPRGRNAEHPFQREMDPAGSLEEHNIVPLKPAQPNEIRDGILYPYDQYYQFLVKWFNSFNVELEKMRNSGTVPKRIVINMTPASAAEKERIVDLAPNDRNTLMHCDLVVVGLSPSVFFGSGFGPKKWLARAAAAKDLVDKCNRIGLISSKLHSAIGAAPTIENRRLPSYTQSIDALFTLERRMMKETWPWDLLMARELEPETNNKMRLVFKTVMEEVYFGQPGGPDGNFPGEISDGRSSNGPNRDERGPGRQIRDASLPRDELPPRDHPPPRYAPSQRRTLLSRDTHPQRPTSPPRDIRNKEELRDTYLPKDRRERDRDREVRGRSSARDTKPYGGRNDKRPNRREERRDTHSQRRFIDEEDDIERKIQRQREELIRRERARDMIEPLDDVPVSHWTSINDIGYPGSANGMVQHMGGTLGLPPTNLSMPPHPYGLPQMGMGMPPVGGPSMPPFFSGSMPGMMVPNYQAMEDERHQREEQERRFREEEERRFREEEERRLREEQERARLLKEKEDEMKRKLQEELEERKKQMEDEIRKQVQAEERARIQAEMNRAAQRLDSYGMQASSSGYDRPASQRSTAPFASLDDYELNQIRQLAKDMEDKLLDLQRNAQQSTLNAIFQSKAFQTMAQLGDNAHLLTKQQKHDLLYELRTLLGVPDSSAKVKASENYGSFIEAFSSSSSSRKRSRSRSPSRSRNGGRDRHRRSSDGDRKSDWKEVRFQSGHMTLRNLSPAEQKKLRRNDTVVAKDLKTGRWVSGRIMKIQDNKVTLPIGNTTWKKNISELFIEVV